MRGKRIAKASVLVVALATGWAIASGALAAVSQRQQDYMKCVDGSVRTDTKQACCALVGGTWIEIYDADGQVVDQGCTSDNGNDLEDGSLLESNPAIAPGVLDNVVSGAVGADPTPSADPAPALESEGTPAESGTIEQDGDDAVSTPAPAPEKLRRKHKHRRHRR
jgi:hypothetical protein